LQEVDQILHLLRGESYLEALIVELYELEKISCSSIVEVRRPGSNTSQNRALDAADIGALSGDQRFCPDPSYKKLVRIPDLEYTPTEGPAESAAAIPQG